MISVLFDAVLEEDARYITRRRILAEAIGLSLCVAAIVWISTAQLAEGPAGQHSLCLI